MKKLYSLLTAVLIMASVFMPAFASNAAYISGYTTKVDYENTDPNKYTVDIDLTNQIITVIDNYKKTIVKQALCTTGKASTPTPSGTHKLGHMKERFGYFVAFGQYAQYWTQIIRGIYIHSVMYDSQNTSTMSRSAYNTLGKSASHGCVRTTPEMAKFIFYNCPPETTCKVANRSANKTLVNQVKAKMPSYSESLRLKDQHAWPIEIPAVVKYNKTPLRSGSSSVNAETIGYLKANTKCLISQISPTWCKVKTSSGKLGYIKTEYLLFNPDDYEVVKTIYTTGNSTNVYARAKTTSKLKGSIPKGARITYIAPYNSQWCVAEYKNNNSFVSGHVQLSNLRRTAIVDYPILAGYESSTSYETAKNVLFTRNDIRANMRSSASTDSSIITVLDPGTMLQTLSRNGSWYYCQANGYIGYIHKSCIFN